MMPRPLPDFVAVGNEVDCLYQAPNEQAFEFQGQIIAISLDHTQVKVMAIQDSAEVTLPVEQVLRLTENASDIEAQWGAEPYEAAPAIAAAEVVNASQTNWQFAPGYHVMAESPQYGGEWGGIILDISQDGTKLQVQWDDGGTVEIVPTEKAVVDQEDTAMMGKTMSMGKAAPKAAAPVAAASGFEPGQKVNALYSGDGVKYPATITAISSDGSRAKITWDADGSGATVAVTDLARKRGRQAGTHVAKPAAAAATAGNGHGLPARGKRQTAAAASNSIAVQVAELLKGAKKPDYVELASYLPPRVKTGIIGVFGGAA
jgi:hypothetical protein